ncbi:hypothetical protein [Limnohabitans sp. 2KL-3]|uniref:hypothetical protein n=1 Tax=Limnohabitans sp. 2KL-3 TaxID=1100700 RepID=UPI000A949A96|nr:hypothetical protein [Limnohabitans sp. 2KL-3]
MDFNHKSHFVQRMRLNKSKEKIFSLNIIPLPKVNRQQAQKPKAHLLSEGGRS